MTLRNTDLTDPGIWIIALSATDRLGFKNTLTTTFYYGYPVPHIISPDNQYSFNNTVEYDLNLEGNNIFDALMAHYWYNNSGDELGGGFNITKTFVRGYHKIFYVATDTAGVGKSDSVEFIVNASPTVEIQQEKNDGSLSSATNLRYQVPSPKVASDKTRLAPSLTNSVPSSVSEVHLSHFRFSLSTSLPSHLFAIPFKVRV